MTCPPLTREKAMRLPSGDHERSTLSSAPLVSSRRTPSLALTVKICQLPAPRPAKAIVLPFGDHEGAASSIGFPAAPLVPACHAGEGEAGEGESARNRQADQ